jgi:prepilin-type N-terminal cleavage/methylation domain-containing protein
MRFATIKPSGQRRQAFTLVEILVVVAIIAILVALSAGIYYYAIGGQQQRNTEGTIRAVNKVFQTQWSYVVDQAKKESPSLNVVNLAADPTGERARVLWIKIRLMEAFPISYDEINNPANSVYQLLNLAIPGTAGQPQRKAWKTYQNATAKQGSSPTTTASESSACLLMALTVSRGGAVLSPDQLGSYVADTDGDGVKEIVDGWRTPLVFYRFAWGSGALPGRIGDPPQAPSGIQGLNPAPAGSKAARLGDPLDPAGSLFTWPGGAARTAFESNFHAIADASGKNANYVIPVIVSLDADRDIFAGTPTPSLFPPTVCATKGLTVQNASTAGDNTYSFTLRGN